MNDDLPKDPLPYRSGEDDLRERGQPAYLIFGAILGLAITGILDLIPAGIAVSIDKKLLLVFGVLIFAGGIGVVVGCCIAFMLQGICFSGIAISG